LTVPPASGFARAGWRVKQKRSGLAIIRCGGLTLRVEPSDYIHPRLSVKISMNELVLMAHVMFGVGCLVTTIWVFVDVLNVSGANQARIQKMSCAAAVFIWVAFLIAGYWYVFSYPMDKAVILKGPWPFAHNFFMETKEHLVLLLLLLATYLPIAAANNLSVNKGARRVVLWVAGLVVMLALTMEGDGATIAMGVKMGLLAAQH
jgi:hypothetical protein